MNIQILYMVEDVAELRDASHTQVKQRSYMSHRVSNVLLSSVDLQGIM